MAKHPAVLLACAALGTHGLRQGRQSKVAEEPRPHGKTIAGIPVVNYDLAYGGRAATASVEGLQEHWLVFTKDGTTDFDLAAFCMKAKGGCEQVGHPGQGGLPFFGVRGTEAELAEVLQAEGRGLLVDFVEPDTEVAAIPEFDAAPASSSWGLNRVGAPTRARSGRGAHIYVLDTGVRVSHQDFGGRAFAAVDITEGVPVRCTDDMPTCANDANGHGTHCAGTAAGTSYGVASEANVYGVKVLANSGFGSMSWIYVALDYLRGTSAKRPTVASLSLGGSGILSGMERAIDMATQAGVTVVVAGGNDNQDACGFTPAYVASAITVGSTDSTDTRSSFSNYGECTNLWAPGSDITSAAHDSNTGSATFSGTSMACPHVAGAAALVLASNPDFMPEKVLSALHASAETDAVADLRSDDTNKLLWVGGGPAPNPAPTPAPPAEVQCDTEMAVSRWPDKDGDCKCKELNWYTQLYCTRSGPLSEKYDCPQSGREGKFAGLYFSPTCTDCQCLTYKEIHGRPR